MRRALFWVGVALTIALVAFGIWYYVRDDYPFQLSSDQIAGLSYHSVPSAGSGMVSVSGYISHPPADLAEWVSSMEKDSSDETVPVTTVVTVVLTDGRQLRLFLGGSRGFGGWVEPGGSHSAPVGVQLNQPFVWYLQGVGDALAASRQVEPQPTPSALPLSPTPSPVSASPTP
jgi:hypothetical protein